MNKCSLFWSITQICQCSKISYTHIQDTIYEKVLIFYAVSAVLDITRNKWKRIIKSSFTRRFCRAQILIYKSHNIGLLVKHLIFVMYYFNQCFVVFTSTILRIFFFHYIGNSVLAMKCSTYFVYPFEKGHHLYIIHLIHIVHKLFHEVYNIIRLA